jgi:glutathione S-transferase
MKLYYSPGACSLSPHIVALEAGIPLELKKVDLGKKTLEDGSDYKAVNPKGYVPALEVSPGKVLTEGPAIVQYLADQKPDSGLAPKNGTWERYKVQEALNFVTSELHKGMGALFNPAVTPEWRKGVMDRLDLRLKALDDMLGERDYVAGDAFSVADAYLFTVLGWARPLKIDLSPYKNVGAYLARVGARPAVQEAMKAEGLTKG